MKRKKHGAVTSGGTAMGEETTEPMEPSDEVIVASTNGHGGGEKVNEETAEVPEPAAPPVVSAPPAPIADPRPPGLRLPVKVWTDPLTKQRYLAPTAIPGPTGMSVYVMHDTGSKVVKMSPVEWNRLPSFYFQEDGLVPRGRK